MKCKLDEAYKRDEVREDLKADRERLEESSCFSGKWGREWKLMKNLCKG